MVSLVIYGIIAIALASAAGYAFLVFTNTSKQTTYSQENSIRMETAVAAVRANLLALAPGTNSGLVFAPMGANGVTDGVGHTYTGLPAILGVSGSAPWGQPYLYCPVSLNNASGLATNALNSVGTTSVQSPSGATYSVSTYIGAATGGNTANGAAGVGAYVIASAGAPIANISNSGYQAGYVAFIVSSLGPGLTIPDCSSISVSTTTGSVTVAGGTVRGVTGGFPYNQRVIAASDRAEFYVASAVSGDGSGRDAGNATTLDFALNLWQSLQPRQTDIYLASGVTFNVNSDLDSMNASVGKPFADGENSSLVIGTVPGATSLATLRFTTPVTLDNNTTFKNVSISTGFALTTLKPLLMNNVSYTASTAGTAMNVIGTSLTVNDSVFTGAQIRLSNATAEFYNRLNTTSSFSNTQIVGSLSNVSFDGAGSPTYAFTGSAVNAINLTGSSLNVASNATLAASSTITSLQLSNSSLNVGGILNVSGGSSLGGINAVDGSAISIPSGGVVNVTPATSMSFGVWLQGSKLGLEGKLSTTSLSSGGGAIGIQQGELTGAGIITVGQQNTVPCLRLFSGVADNALSAGTNPGSAFVSIPIYFNPSSASDSGAAFSANLPSFAQAQYGYPPMLNYLNGTTSGGAYPAAETTASGRLGNAYSAPNSPNNDPWVYTIAAITALPNANQLIAYVDPTTLERAVRNLVNSEFVTGTGLNFAGTCPN